MNERRMKLIWMMISKLELRNILGKHRLIWYLCEVIKLLYYLLMERMIKRIAVRKDWTISMSEFRNFAEKYQWEIDKLEEENKKLNEYNRRLKQGNDDLKEQNKKLKEELDRMTERACDYKWEIT